MHTAKPAENNPPLEFIRYLLTTIESAAFITDGHILYYSNEVFDTLMPEKDRNREDISGYFLPRSGCASGRDWLEQLQETPEKMLCVNGEYFSVRITEAPEEEGSLQIVILR